MVEVLVYGRDDPVGSVETWERFAETLRNGVLFSIADSGHLNWYDKPQEIATQITTHLENFHM